MAMVRRGILTTSLLSTLVCASLLAPAVARAADMPMAPSLDSIDEERVTLGTGWYLRGDAAASNDNRLQLGPVTLPSSKSFFNSWSLGIGGGYQWNNWFRTDITVDWRAPRTFQGNTVAGLPCQIGAAPVTTAGVVTGSTPIYAACADTTRQRVNDLHALFNAYVDLGTWAGVTPYLGAGVGFNYIYQKGSVTWTQNNGVPYNPTWTDPFTGGTYSAYWDQYRSGTSLQFAWALMGGISYDLMSHVKIDLGYRYLNLGSVTTYSSSAGQLTTKLKAQELRLGLRYTPD